MVRVLIFSRNWKFGAFLKALLESRLDKDVEVEFVTSLNGLRNAMRILSPSLLVVNCESLTPEDAEWIESAAALVKVIAICGWGDRVPKNVELLKKPLTYGEIAEKIVENIREHLSNI